MSKKDPFPWRDPALIYIVGVILVTLIFVYGVELL